MRRPPIKLPNGQRDTTKKAAALLQPLRMVMGKSVVSAEVEFSVLND